MSDVKEELADSSLTSDIFPSLCSSLMSDVFPESASDGKTSDIKERCVKRESPNIAMKERASLFIIAGVILSGILLTGFWFFSSIDNNDRNVADRENFEENNKNRVVEYTVEDGDTWETIVKKLDLGWDLGLSLLEASQGAHNLASIHAGNELRLLFDLTTNGLESVEYDIDEEKFLVIEKNEEGGFGADTKDIEYEIDITTKRGIIESSLFETAQEKGIAPGVILELAWLFSWDIDFASSVQAGDSFVLSYEERFRNGEYAGSGKILSARFTNSGKDFYVFFYENPEGDGGYYTMDGKEVRRQFLRSPLDYKRITSGFSYNRFHPILNTFTTHRAVDYAAPSGTPVSATADGWVNYVGWKGGNGKYIGIKHGNGYTTGYAHLSAYARGIKSGAQVKQNQVIGFVGSTGLSTGPHLHYGMRKNGVLINPLRLDLPPGESMKEEYLDDFGNKRDRLLELLEFQG